jgi:hypothetical protein
VGGTGGIDGQRLRRNIDFSCRNKFLHFLGVIRAPFSHVRQAGVQGVIAGQSHGLVGFVRERFRLHKLPLH